MTVTEEIDGWMTSTELTWLALQASRHNKIVEIGSYLGRSTKVMAEATPGVVYAVDCWEDPGNIQETISQHLSKLNVATLYEGFCKNCDNLIQAGRIVPIKSRHESLPKELDTLTPDMVFIDGDHSYEAVHRDISYWLPKVKGLMCGHDSFHAELMRAVNELMGNVTVAVNTDIWYKEL